MRPSRQRNRLAARSGVVKAQIHAGGRGKGSGVKLARSLDEVPAYQQFSACSSSRIRPDRKGLQMAAAG